MRIITLVAVVMVAVVAMALLQGAAPPRSDQQSSGSQTNGFVESVQKEVRNLGQQVSEGFRDAKQKIDQLSTEGRVYGRLHWDKGLQDMSIYVDVDNHGLAVLRGTVPNEAAKTKAEQITKDTVGIDRVQNDLVIDAKH